MRLTARKIRSVNHLHVRHSAAFSPLTVVSTTLTPRARISPPPAASRPGSPRLLGVSVGLPSRGVSCKGSYTPASVAGFSLGTVCSSPARCAWRLRSCSRLSAFHHADSGRPPLTAFPAFQVFHESIVAVSDRLTRCTLQLYTDIVQDLPPTPSKFHYIFNLRDLSRVFHGLVLTNPER